MDGKRRFLQVSFELKSRGLNELLIFRIMRHLRNMRGNIGSAHPFQIDVEKCIGPRQQSRRLRGRVLPQLHDQSYRGHKGQKSKQDGKDALNPHGELREMTSKYVAVADVNFFTISR